MESASQVVAEAPIEPAPPPGQFSGVHFALGAQVGAGPAFVTAFSERLALWTNFGGSAVMAPIELRLALLIGRFELALEGAPGSTMIIGAGPRGLASASLSVGGLIKLYEQGDFGVYLPLRARGSLVFASFGVAPGLGASTGVGFRFGAFMLEARGAFELASWGTRVVTSIPITAAATYVF